MDSCCENKASELAALRERQGRVLYLALAINALMFVIEFSAGWLAGSTALLGDSLDMFGDASVYALTLFVLQRSERARTGAALFKGICMLLFALLVIADALRQLVTPELPQAGWMGAISLLALCANGLCFALLYRHRSDDLNMRSTWLCSRNDLLANTSVLVAAVLVQLYASRWPDFAVGLAIALLFLHSAWQILGQAWQQWRGGSTCCSSTSSEPCCSPLAGTTAGEGMVQIELPH